MWLRSRNLEKFRQLVDFSLLRLAVLRGLLAISDSFVVIANKDLNFVFTAQKLLARVVQAASRHQRTAQRRIFRLEVRNLHLQLLDGSFILSLIFRLVLALIGVAGLASRRLRAVHR